MRRRAHVWNGQTEGPHRPGTVAIRLVEGNGPSALFLVGRVETGGWNGLYLFNDGINVSLFSNLLAISVGDDCVMGPNLAIVQTEVGGFEGIRHADGGIGRNNCGTEHGP